MIRVRVLAVVAVAALVAPAAGCQQDPPSPSQQAAERLHRAADHLDRAGSVELLVTMTVGGTLWSGRQRGTAWLSLGADSAASRATADVDVKAVGDDQSVEIEFRDPGQGTTYLRAPSVGTRSRPWRAFEGGFAKGPDRGVVVPISHLLSAPVLDPREYLRPAAAGPNAFAYHPTDEPTRRDTVRFDAQCHLSLSCKPGERFRAWLATNSRATAWFDATVRLDADGRLASFEVAFDYGADPGRVVQVAIRAVVSRTGEPVTVAAPEDARTVPAA